MLSTLLEKGGRLVDNTSEIRRSTTVVYRRDRQAMLTAGFCLARVNLRQLILVFMLLFTDRIAVQVYQSVTCAFCVLTRDNTFERNMPFNVNIGTVVSLF